MSVRSSVLAAALFAAWWVRLGWTLRMDRKRKRRQRETCESDGEDMKGWTGFESDDS